MADEDHDHDHDHDLTDAVRDAAQQPQEVQVAGMGMDKSQRLKDIVEAAKFLAPAATRKRIGGGMRFNKAVAGGAVYPTC